MSSNNLTALLYPLYPYNSIFDVVGVSLINLTCPFCTSNTLHFKSFSCISVDAVFAVDPEYVAKFDINVVYFVSVFDTVSGVYAT